MPTFVVLLRGVNVGGANKVPMAEFRAGLAKAGFTEVQTYVNSGNAVMKGNGTPASVEAKVEALLARRFKVEVPVVVRTAQQWADYPKGNPFPSADPKALHLGLGKAKPAGDCAERLLERARAGERVGQVGDAVWIDFAGSGVARSKLTPAAIDKAAGCPVTARNWNTVVKLAELADPA